MVEEGKILKSEAEVRLRIVLIAPPVDVHFGIQEGKGSGYTTIHKQRSKDADLTFEFTVIVKDNRDVGCRTSSARWRKGRRWAASFTLTSESLPDRSTLVGNAASRFPWVESLGT